MRKTSRTALLSFLDGRRQQAWVGSGLNLSSNDLSRGFRFSQENVAGFVNSLVRRATPKARRWVGAFGGLRRRLSQPRPRGLGGFLDRGAPAIPGNAAKTEKIRNSTDFVLEMFRYLIYPSVLWEKGGRPQPFAGSRRRYRYRLVPVTRPRTGLCKHVSEVQIVEWGETMPRIIGAGHSVAKRKPGPFLVFRIGT